MKQYANSIIIKTAHSYQRILDEVSLFLHLSQLINVLFFPIGIIAPILIWQLNKEKTPALDPHGKMVVNWFISSVIYAFVSVILIFVFFLGLIPLFGLIVAGIAFPIIGAVKANKGEFWEYPLTIKFLK